MQEPLNPVWILLVCLWASPLWFVRRRQSPPGGRVPRGYSLQTVIATRTRKRERLHDCSAKHFQVKCRKQRPERRLRRRPRRSIIQEMVTCARSRSKFGPVSENEFCFKWQLFKRFSGGGFAMLYGLCNPLFRESFINSSAESTWVKFTLWYFPSDRLLIWHQHAGVVCGVSVTSRYRSAWWPVSVALHVSASHTSRAVAVTIIRSDINSPPPPLPTPPRPFASLILACTVPAVTELHSPFEC